MAALDDWQAREDALEDVHRALVENGVLVPLELGGADEARWSDHDLASFAENRLGEFVDPADVDRAIRERWMATALDPAEPFVMPRRRESEACYWIVHQGRRAGTLALARFCLGDTVSAYSVYLRPGDRGAGIMGRTLTTVYAELEARGLGLRLDAYWTWQPAIRFYLRNGFWLRSWKRELAFHRRPLGPRPVIAIDDTEASVAVEIDGSPMVVARATRQGDRLLHHDEEPDLPDSFQHVACDGRTTLGLAIAIAGWPLIRSANHWHRCRTSDLLHPEALADRIQDWEAWAAVHGWRVETPRIPGLDYASWAVSSTPS